MLLLLLPLHAITSKTSPFLLASQMCDKVIWHPSDAFLATTQFDVPYLSWLSCATLLSRWKLFDRMSNMLPWCSHAPLAALYLVSSPCLHTSMTSLWSVCSRFKCAPRHVSALDSCDLPHGGPSLPFAVGPGHGLLS